MKKTFSRASAINVSRDMGVIPDSVFCMLVIMALFTTFMTTPLLRLLLGKPSEQDGTLSNDEVPEIDERAQVNS